MLIRNKPHVISEKILLQNEIHNSIIKLDKDPTVGIEINSLDNGRDLVTALTDTNFISYVKVNHYKLNRGNMFNHHHNNIS